MNLTSELYGLRQSGNSHGDVFTSSAVVKFMLDLVGYTPDKDLSKFRVLEPSFGEGDFLLEIQHRLIQSASSYNFNPIEIMEHNIYGCEIDESKFNRCLASIRENMPSFIPYNLKKQDFLFSKWDTDFHVVIGNPPYIRYENIPADLREKYKGIFNTFYYRCDLYVLFFEHSLHYLMEDGKHCFICSNRWLKNEYGKILRSLISSQFHLEYIIDIEKINAFKESVLAYPSITLITNLRERTQTKISTISDIKELRFPLQFSARQIKNHEDWGNLFLSRNIDKFPTLEQQGFSIGIGVATGADKIFISPALKGNIEDELLLPIISAKDLSGNKLTWRKAYLLNPFQNDGSLINLAKYEKAQRYLTQYKEKLEIRHIVKGGRCWYALIDKVKPSLVSQPKILLPDISGNTVIFVDKGDYYPAHNIYYITGKTIFELKVLAAFLMSDFVKTQVENISNKMNGGFPRWQSQTIKKIRIPTLDRIPTSLKEKLVEAYQLFRLEEINDMVKDIVKLDLNKQKNVSYFPQSLFEYDIV